MKWKLILQCLTFDVSQFILCSMIMYLMYKRLVDIQFGIIMMFTTMVKIKFRIGEKK